MKQLLSCILALALGFSSSRLPAQNVPIGQWKDYLSYENNLKVCQGQNMIYCTSQSGIFSYNLNDNSLERYNKVTGLSDVSPTIARFNPYNNVLVIGYTDGNIDILQGNQVINMPDMKNQVTEGSKLINDIYFVNNIAYISCGQGILEIDLNQDIVLGTLNVNSSGNQMIYGMTIYKDTIFAAAIDGLFKGPVNANLSNYGSWLKVPSSVLPRGAYTAIVTLGNTVVANFSNALTYNIHGADTLFSYNGGTWSHYSYIQGNGQVYSLESTNGFLVISLGNEVKVVNQAAVLVNDIDSYGTDSYGTIYASPKDAIIDANMNIWIADIANGLVKTSANFTGTFIYPPGPYSNFITDLKVENNNIWIAPGGYNQSLTPDGISNIGISTYQNGTWSRILDTSKTIYDLNIVAIDPNDATHAFVGSWGNGLVEYNNSSVTKVYDTTNSSLQNITGYNSIRVGGLSYDTLGNLWVTNSLATSRYLSVKKTDGSWMSFDFGNFLSQQVSVVKLLVTKDGAKWMVVPGTGILVYQDNGTFAAPSATNTVLITSATGKGALPDLNISSMAQDLDGTVWIGTDMSVVAFYSPDNVTDGNSDWDAQPVYVNQGGYTQYLMQNQVTNAIAIDGANRKWIGTVGGGVFLMSSDGTQQVYNFTAENSPLLSDNINCISINQINGEVFFATDKGLVSFRSTATQGNNVFNNVYAFPNPVPQGYDGVIAITGLVGNADVKITTANGELVYHTVALGGQAIWNGTNFSGKRVDTGVYLVFCASPDGTQSHVTKLLFLN